MLPEQDVAAGAGVQFHHDRVLIDHSVPLGDFLARDREVTDVQPGGYMAICATGAYGFVASSNYNSRPRPPEVLVEGQQWRVIRERETFEDLVRGESR